MRKLVVLLLAVLGGLAFAQLAPDVPRLAAFVTSGLTLENCNGIDSNIVGEAPQEDVTCIEIHERSNAEIRVLIDDALREYEATVAAAPSTWLTAPDGAMARHVLLKAEAGYWLELHSVDDGFILAVVSVPLD